MNIKKLPKPVSCTPPNFHQRQIEAYAAEILHVVGGRIGVRERRKDVQERSISALKEAGFTCSAPFTRYGKGGHGVVTSDKNNALFAQLGSNQSGKWTYRNLTEIRLEKRSRFNNWKRGCKALQEVRLAELYSYVHSMSKINGLAIRVEVGGVSQHNHLSYYTHSPCGATRFRLHFRTESGGATCFTYVISEKDERELWKLRCAVVNNSFLDANKLLEHLEATTTVKRYKERLERDLVKSRGAKLRLLYTTITPSVKKKVPALSQAA